MRLGIIGGTGMLGHHIAIAAIFKQYELVIIHREGSHLSKISDLKYESRTADLDNRGSLIKAFDGLDYVVNAAAYYPTIPRPLSAELKTARLQMQFFIDAVREAKIKRALYVGGAIAIPKSSTGVANESGIYTKIPENSAPYVQVKCLMDEMARDAAKSDLPIVIGIPSMTFGEYDYGPTTGRLIVELSNQTLPAYIKGDRNVVFAGDAGRGLLLALEKGSFGERYLISGDNTNTDDLVALICKKAGVKPLAKTLSLKFAKIISKIQETRYALLRGTPPTLSSTAIAVLSGGQHLDGSKAKNELGYVPEMSAEDAVHRAYHWFKKEGYIAK
ncbi:NAD-dependent epimerase/dehydratase family protein [Roseivirga sp. E12]|uniref:NAD-dependent epimerase/dehydratase family protein n=1 Tax=Roseivirga sp. E12 TaxID=2819237 RepID=UPI001ABC0579|nr:NAD-dependent epimerase/dehydratase family protein [Roseivirga sp. E12]MBO3700565.1 NAD-dependent epimerase/dehydratase family protein [Roseivirga sp. E12]